MTMSAEAETAEPELHEKAAKAIHKHIKTETENVNLQEYEKIDVEMAVTQICGLGRIHRQTLYDNGVLYQLQERYKSIDYKENEGVFIDGKQFLREFES